MMIDIPKDRQLILFDGVCNLCNSSVLFVIKRDPKNTFLFAPLQSKVGKQITATFGIDPTQTDSILLYQPTSQKLYTKSTAVLHIAKKLTFPISVLSIFFILPPFIRNSIYDVIAKHRYKWYGKKETCMIPTPELQAKFLDDGL